MEWEKAKTILIICLSVLNIFLTGIFHIQRSQYQMKGDQITAIELLLGENQIELTQDYPIRFDPMSELILRNGEWDTDFLKELFFNGSNYVKRTVQQDNTIFKEGSASLTVDTKEIRYRNDDGLMIDPYIFAGGFNRDTATQFAETFILKMGNDFEGYQLDTVIVMPESYQFKYYERYGNYKVFCNYVLLDITAQGLTKVAFARMEPEGFEGLDKHIISSDEALFTFLQNYRQSNVGTITHITKVDIGYNIKDYHDYNFEKFTAKPHYRIFTSNSAVPFLIDAYTNEVE